jgi:hypothetical protein
MMQADDDGSSDLDDDDFLGGLSPNDESTPLNLSRGKSLLIKPTDKSSPSPSESPLSPGGSRKRKRMTQEIQVPQSPVDMVEDTPTATPIRHGDSRHDIGHELPEDDEAEPDDEELGDQEVDVERVEATPQSQRFPEILSQTMLPPASSPAGSVTPSDSTPRPVQRKKSKAPSHLSTANLQDKLLPRRRRRLRAINDYSDESDDQYDAASGDEDELNYPSQRSSGRRAGKSKPKPLANSRNPKQKKIKEKKTKDKSKEPATYSRSRTSGVNKENETILSSPSSSPLSSPPESDVSDSESVETEATRCVSDELRAAVKKFAEVDQWEMEFEDVSASES